MAILSRSTLGLLGATLLACAGPMDMGDAGADGAARDTAVQDSAASSDASTPPADSSADAAAPMVDTVSPTCVDGMYRETLPTGSESVSDITFNAANLSQSALAYLDRRYPTGAAIVRGCGMAESNARCVDSWVLGAGRMNAADFMLSLSTVVHEAGHLYDLSMRSGFGSYWLTPSTRLSCDMGDTVARGGRTFARSELYADEFQSQFRACASLTERNCDSYAYIYLDPARGLGPAQGFASVLEETTQYINSLATGYVFRDQIRGSRSERDGILAFLWYVERYLYRARTMHPDAYAFIRDSACWREAILTVWGRAWLYLQHTDAMRPLEIYAPTFMTAVRNPVLLAEIQRIRDAHGCR